MASKEKIYVVWKGRQTGVFTSWKECSVQVTGFPGAEYKGFANGKLAQQAYRGNYEDYKGKQFTEEDPDWLFDKPQPIADSYSVDAACSGSPGPVEYRGVHTTSRTQIFHQGPYPNGTNNVGEFLAIVHALAYLKKKGFHQPVYSDSENAIGWVKGKKCKTNLKADEQNKELFELIARAETWLRENEWDNPLLKWDTRIWGEIPADFGRK